MVVALAVGVGAEVAADLAGLALAEDAVVGVLAFAVTGVGAALPSACGLPSAPEARAFSAESSRLPTGAVLALLKAIICNIENIMSLPAPEDQNIKV